jgi:extracellular factor (EF) 3-hydroxypalmitic acid methyl ester biosynthesis protein
VKICLNHPIRHLVWNDPFTQRAFQKPRGYAGDASLLDYIYGADEIYEVADRNQIPSDTSPLGRAIFATTTRTPTCEGVRIRARLVAEMVDRLVLEKPGASILSIASGHLREANLTGALKRRRVGRWVAFDADSDSLGEVQRATLPTAWRRLPEPFGNSCGVNSSWDRSISFTRPGCMTIFSSRWVSD